MGNVIITGTGGVANVTTGGTTVPFSGFGTGTITTPVNFNAQQIAGLVKMIPCNFVDCRTPGQIWCYYLPVFGASSLNQPASYTNDWNSFLVNFSGMGTPKFTLQRAQESYTDMKDEKNWVWLDVADITNNNYGLYYPLGSISGHPTYMMFQPNWGNIFTRNGAGFYRILFQSCQPVFQGTQASSQPVETPWTAAVNSVIKASVYITITCGKKTYTVPTFTVNGNALADANAICAAINAITSSSFPFTAAPVLVSGVWFWQLFGTGGAAQNGCSFKVLYKHFSNTGTVDWEVDLVAGNVLEGGSGSPTQSCTCGLQSPIFRLLKWDCYRADGTTKFEVWNQGTTSDVNTPGLLFDLCGISIYDSIRVRGYLGYNEYTYDTIVQEYGIDNTHPFGDNVIVRDKFIPGYKWKSDPLPMWVHKQMATIMMMADTVLASDYNITNPDYFIQRKKIIKKPASGWKPEYISGGKHFDLSLMDFGRRDSVTIEFLEGIQSGIKSTCCISVSSSLYTGH